MKLQLPKPEPLFSLNANIPKARASRRSYGRWLGHGMYLFLRSPPIWSVLPCGLPEKKRKEQNNEKQRTTTQTQGTLKKSEPVRCFWCVCGQIKECFDWVAEPSRAISWLLRVGLCSRPKIMQAARVQGACPQGPIANGKHARGERKKKQHTAKFLQDTEKEQKQKKPNKIKPWGAMAGQGDLLSEFVASSSFLCVCAIWFLANDMPHGK